MTKLKMLCGTINREVSRFRADDNGATAIEYAMIAAGISLAIIGVISGLGANLKTTFYEKLAALL